MSMTAFGQLELTTMASTFESETIIQEDWAETLCGAPGILLIMGEAMVLASVPSAAQIRLSQDQLSAAAPPNLIGSTLPASLYECKQMGEKAFLEAHTGMTKINMYSKNVLPAIDSIVRVFNQPRTAATTALIDLHIRKLTRGAKTCTDTALSIKKRFDDWRFFTEELGKGVFRQRGDASIEKGEREQIILLQKNKIVLAEKDEEHAESARIEAQRKLDRAVENRTAAAQSAQKAFNAADTAMIMTPNPVGGVFLGLGIYAAGMGFEALAQKDVRKAEKLAEKKRKSKEEHELRALQLVHDMRVLQDKQTTLKEVTKILSESLFRLNQLQSNVDQLLIFFTNISAYVVMLKENIDGDFVTQLQIPASLNLQERDACLEQAVRDQALDAKFRFVVMSRVSQAYSQVSKAWIIPGFRIIDRMALFEDSISSVGVRERSSELNRYKDEATEQIRMITDERQGELQQSVQRIIQEIAEPILGG